MVLGNKCDINDKRQVSKDRGEKVRNYTQEEMICDNNVMGANL